MKSSDEVQTTEVEDEKTAFSRFCHKHGINSNLIMLKVTLFVMYGGERITYIIFIFISILSC